jgi:hypothetical protein
MFDPPGSKSLKHWFGLAEFFAIQYCGYGVMLSGQENIETPIVNNIVYNFGSGSKESICIFPWTQSGLHFACHLPRK